MKTYPLLEKAPLHDSPAFIDYLKKNNTVVWENAYWLVIENCKYHTPEQTWYTAFVKNKNTKWNMPSLPSPKESVQLLGLLIRPFGDYEWLKKAKNKQTVQRFHVHFIKRD